MNKAKAFIQGSYFNPTDHFSYCGIIHFKDEKYIIKGSINNGEYIAMKSVGGILFGTLKTLEKAEELGITEIDFYHGLDLITGFVNKTLLPRQQATKNFTLFLNVILKKIKVNFIKVPKKEVPDDFIEAKQIARDMLGTD